MCFLTFSSVATAFARPSTNLAARRARKTLTDSLRFLCLVVFACPFQNSQPRSRRAVEIAHLTDSICFLYFVLFACPFRNPQLRSRRAVERAQLTASILCGGTAKLDLSCGFGCGCATRPEASSQLLGDFPTANSTANRSGRMAKPDEEMPKLNAF